MQNNNNPKDSELDFPPLKTGINALCSFLVKNTGLIDICNDETEQLFTAFTNKINAKRKDHEDAAIHILMSDSEFVIQTARAAEKSYLLTLELIRAMNAGKAERVRTLLRYHKLMTPIIDVAEMYIDEETKANSKCLRSNTEK